jgi:hypothetical protein
MDVGTLLFLPICCPLCGRTSAISVSAAGVGRDLERESAIVLRCVHDEARWNATSMERAALSRLLEEELAMAKPGRMRLREAPALWLAG